MTKALHKFLTKFLRNRDRDEFMLRPDVGRGLARYRYDIRRPWHDYMKAQGHLWITPHVMRHSFAPPLLQAGVSPYKISRWLGHSLKVFELHYGHLIPGSTEIDLLRPSKEPRKRKTTPRSSLSAPRSVP